MLKTLIFLASVSLRSANIETAPFDYEVEMGLKLAENQVAMLIEREAGQRYRGRDIRLSKHRLYFTDYQRSAKKIDSQELSYLCGKKLKWGATLATKRWSGPVPLATLAYKTDWLDVRLSAGQRLLASLEIGQTKRLTKWLSIRPLAVVRHSDGRRFWQAKVSFSMGRQGG